MKYREKWTSSIGKLASGGKGSKIFLIKTYLGSVKRGSGIGGVWRGGIRAGCCIHKCT